MIKDVYPVSFSYEPTFMYVFNGTYFPRFSTIPHKQRISYYKNMWYCTIFWHRAVCGHIPNRKKGYPAEQRNPTSCWRFIFRRARSERFGAMVRRGTRKSRIARLLIEPPPNPHSGLGDGMPLQVDAVFLSSRYFKRL